MPWYVIHTKPHEESRAAENLLRQQYEVFLPLVTVQRKRRNRIENQTEPMFHRYLFIQLDDTTSNWYPIRSTRGVHGLVRFGDTDPCVVPDELIQMLRQETEQGVPAPLFHSGEELKVRSGPFVGLVGWFSELKILPSGEARAYLLLDILGKTQRLGFSLEEVAR